MLILTKNKSHHPKVMIYINPSQEDSSRYVSGQQWQEEDVSWNMELDNSDDAENNVLLHPDQSKFCFLRYCFLRYCILGVLGSDLLLIADSNQDSDWSGCFGVIGV